MTRLSKLFAKTKRDALAELTDETLRLAYRAGLIRPVERGEFIYLPLGANVISQMFITLRAGLTELGAQELASPLPVQLDALASAEIQSYKHLPARVYWHSNGGTRLHLASLEASHEAAQETGSAFEALARDFFQYAGIAPEVAQGADRATVWYAPHPQLDLEIFKSTNGKYAATREGATLLKPAAPAQAPALVQEVETPHCDTIESLAQLLAIPTSRTAKAIFYASGERVIFAVIRGDLQIDELKVKRALGVDTLRRATEDEIRRVGAVPGYASPIGTRGATIIVDDSVTNSPNLVAGANKAGYHLLNTNVPRDYKPEIVTDIALVRAGDASPHGDGALESVRGVELGTLSALRELKANFLDANGKAQKQIGVTLDLDAGAALLAHVGAHNDDKGIVWSRTIAPYDAYLVVLNADKPEVAQALEKVNDALYLAGLDALVDDRSESAGVKFNDADLLGFPLRVTIGPKTVAQGAVEFKQRLDAEARVVAIDALSSELNEWIGVG